MRLMGVVVGVMCVGCGSSDGSPGGVDISDYFAEVVDVVCQKMRECGADVTDDVCREAYGADYYYDGTTSLSLAIDDGRIVYDAAAAGSCIAELRETSCEIFLNWEGELFDHGFACNFVLRPNTPVGSACYGIGTEGSQSECVHGADCELPMPECGQTVCCEGVCVAVVDVAGEGEACDPSTLCEPFLACVDGSCGFGRAIGDPCVDYCAGDLVCDWQTQSCQELAPLVAVGEPCGSETRCAFPASCVFSTAQDMSVCMAPAGLGEDCSGLTDLPDCGGALYCTGYPTGEPGICVEAARYGDSCEAVPCLDSFFVNRCRDGVCQPPGPDGADCVIDDNCISDTCVDGVCVAPETCP